MVISTLGSLFASISLSASKMITLCRALDQFGPSVCFLLNKITDRMLDM